jgi:hypothetical protein
MSDEIEFFNLRKAGKTYVSKVFTYNATSVERLRHVRMVLEGSDSLHLGEIEGALCLRLTGQSRKTQVTALVSQDDKKVRRLTFQTFRTRAGDWIAGSEKDEFTFRTDEFVRLLAFLKQVEFIDLSNIDNFQIEDISTKPGPKAIIDASDRDLVRQFRSLGEDQRQAALQSLRGALSPDEINVLLGRREGLREFEQHLRASDWSESNWQQYFGREKWVFGYGLDYRIMSQFDREMVVGGAGTDNRNKPTVDFLGTFTDYTALVEIKRPDTPIFKNSKGGRSGTWEFSSEFAGAVSQIIEQKAEWLAFAQSGEHWSKDGSRKLEARTRNARSILVVGTRGQFDESGNARSGQIMRDTFELFRRDLRTIDILTFDELFERAQFITRNDLP